MPELFLEKPGLLFVVATLLPMASFGLLVLAAAPRWGLRPYAKDNAGARAVFEALGGEVTGRGPAYVALAGIALAFVCSLTGFVWFLSDVHEIEHLEHFIHPRHDHPEKKGIDQQNAKIAKEAKEAKEKA